MDIQVEIPKELLRFKSEFEHWRGNNGSCKCDKTYNGIYALAADLDLSLEDIGKQCGGRSKQWVAQILNRYYPGVRPVKNGRRLPARRREREATLRLKRSERRRRMKEQFEDVCINFKLLKKHAEAARFRLGLVWHKGRPLHRVFRINGRKCLAVRICSAANLSGIALYAHCISPVVSSLEDVEDIAVIVEVDSDALEASRLYRISVKKFKAMGQTNILIRLTKRSGNGGPTAVIQWDRSHRLSKLK